MYYRMLALGCCACIVSCTPAPKTPPTALVQRFIGVEETLRIMPNMSKREIGKALGQPLQVVGGLLLEGGDVYEVWMYLARSQRIEVAAKEAHVKVEGARKARDWSDEQPYAVLFKNNKVIKWGHPNADWPDFGAEKGDIYTPTPWVAPYVNLPNPPPAGMEAPAAAQEAPQEPEGGLGGLLKRKNKD